MKKKSKLGLSLIAACLCLGGATMFMTGCDCGGVDVEVKFDFTAKLASGKNEIEIGETDEIQLITNLSENAVIRDAVTGEVCEQPIFEYSLNAPSFAELSNANGVEYVTGVATTDNLIITVTETQSKKVFKIKNLKVVNTSVPANGGFNYASASGPQAIAKRTEILGALEKYAMDTHLTGITLFENGGYVKYHERVVLPTKTYITGYGFGILSEGEIDESKPFAAENNEKWKPYYHSALSQDPSNINAWNASGSVVSDLSSYITSSYFGTKMKDTKNAYEWYPVLAKDKVKGQDYLRPTAVDANGKAATQAGFVPNSVGLYDTWRIYVKTGADGLTYRTASSGMSEFENLGVQLDDYLTPFKVMLTGSAAQSRGGELAGDTSYGIKGAQAFYNKTKTNKNNESIDKLWDDSIANGDLGLKTGTDEVGEYIQFSIINPIDDFTAMYTFSSNLYSPIPESFIKKIGGNGSESLVDGANKYGQFNDDNDILKYTLCLGAYYLESWQERQAIVFGRNDSWFERVQNPNRYKIKGVKMRVIDTSTDEEAVWKEFAENGSLDATGIPTKQLKSQIGQQNVYQTKGDSTFKLNINSCTQERWDELFGNDPDSNWTCKPWMSNDNFLKGLFFSINRKDFAEARGVQPSINYFSDAYLSDPENGISYNDTEAHKKAVASYQTSIKDENGNIIDNFGYSKSKAVDCFKSAVSELSNSGAIKQGTSSKPTTIKIKITWMYQTDTSEYGDEIAKYFTEAFNDPGVCGNRVKLVVEQDAVTNWEDVYNTVMMKGNFDLGFGAISGNTYNPLNFLEVLKSDNSSGFTLNWGPDTSVIDEKKPLVFDGYKWSFDALWAVADHGGVVENGSVIEPVKGCYINKLLSTDGITAINDLENGGQAKITIKFADVGASADFEVTSIRIYLVNAGSFNLEFVKEGDEYIVTISAKDGQDWNAALVEYNKLNSEDRQKAGTAIEHALKLDYYNTYWNFEVYYNIGITTANGKAVSQNFVNCAKNAEEWEADHAKK